MSIKDYAGEIQASEYSDDWRHDLHCMHRDVATIESSRVSTCEADHETF